MGTQKLYSIIIGLPFMIINHQNICGFDEICIALCRKRTKRRSDRICINLEHVIMSDQN
eukprot:UN23782